MDRTRWHHWVVAVLMLAWGPIVGLVTYAQGSAPSTKAVKDAAKNIAASTRLPANDSIYAPPIVNFAKNQHFMYIIPAEQAKTIGCAKVGRNVYVTYEVTDEKTGARKIRFLQAGNTPGSWEEVLWIHEH